MKKIKILTTLLLLLSGIYSIQAQVSSAPAGNNPALKEAALKANKNKSNQKEQKSQNNSSSSKSSTTNNFQLDENDPYQGRKAEFLNQLIVSEIPADFPKYEKWMGVKHYNQIIDDYYRNHLDILKEKVKNKLLRK
ncbi:MAG: hypothetical protein C0448_09735 [Sphingobacteriaceae bacterium]|nr:hypothetical protein [Sphingobacteriaceae bacterium]